MMTTLRAKIYDELWRQLLTIDPRQKAIADQARRAGRHKLREDR